MLSVSLSASTVSVMDGAASSLVSVMLAPETVTPLIVASKEMVSLASRKASSVGREGKGVLHVLVAGGDGKGDVGDGCVVGAFGGAVVVVADDQRQGLVFVELGRTAKRGGYLDGLRAAILGE